MADNKWRISLPKNNIVNKISNRLSLGRNKKQDDLSNEMMRYKGIAVQTLVQVRDRIQNGTFGRGVDLYEALEDLDNGRVKKGETVEFSTDFGVAKGHFVAYKPFIKNSEEQLVVDERLVRKKERKEWTTADVCDFVILPMTQKQDNFFLDCVGKEASGKPFQGAFVSHARKSKFDYLVDSLVQ